MNANVVVITLKANPCDDTSQIVLFDEGRNGLWVMNTSLQTSHDILLADRELPTILGGESDWDCCISYGLGCGKG
ncbi:hypothetical protein VNO77_02118 [Canavalia gladiata]|uniref:Uncharacterized protein n=1 Tax=Canavalia gladiata TaxID=3824 RepID=A0AAN9R6X7_CANGL